MSSSLLEKRLIIIGGKGGVGRTVIATALATLLARRGKKILLAYVRTKQRVAKLLNCPEIDESIHDIRPNLWAVNMNPAAALREQGLKVLRFKSVYKAVLENRLVKYFLKAVPSLDEYSVLGKTWYHTTEMIAESPKYDTVIFDGPATGHLIPMLRIPQVILETVPRGPLTEDAQSIHDLLVNPRQTSFIIVTLAEEMGVKEAIELYHAAKQNLYIQPEHLIVNALYPDDFEAASQLREIFEIMSHDELDVRLAPLFSAARTILKRRNINRYYLNEAHQAIPLPRVELPYLFVPEIDHLSVKFLADRLEAAFFN